MLTGEVFAKTGKLEVMVEASMNGTRSAQQMKRMRVDRQLFEGTRCGNRQGDKETKEKRKETREAELVSWMLSWLMMISTLPRSYLIYPPSRFLRAPSSENQMAESYYYSC